MFSSLFNSILYQPIFNLLIGLYNVMPGHDLGMVILVITIIVRLISYPLTSSSIKAQKALQDLQPKLEEIKKQFPGDQTKQSQATMELYKNNKVNPLASCLPMLIQLPIFIALFLVLRDSLSSNTLSQNIYPFLHNPGQINFISLNFLNLSQPSTILAVLAGLAQFVQAKMMSTKSAPPKAGAGAKDENVLSTMNKQMLYMMPILTVIIGFRFPAGLTLYWFLNTALMVVQQMIIFKKNPQAVAPAVVEGEVVK